VFVVVGGFKCQSCTLLSSSLSSSRSICVMTGGQDSQGKGPSQKCCLGVLYYSQMLQAEGKKPVREAGVISSMKLHVPRSHMQPVCRCALVKFTSLQSV
jgi:hypothetical protein